MRFKGYYAKISISFELMRRKRYWWGYGNWEVVGTASKVVEEPMAIVGTDVKELESSPRLISVRRTDINSRLKILIDLLESK